MRAKDPGTVEFFKAKADALAAGWPEDKANEAGQIAQENYNEAKKEADRQKKLADKKAIKAAPGSRASKSKNKSRKGKTSSGSSGNGSLGTAPGNL
jgi:peptidoglycan hydrolase CwlO-like protein